MRSELKRRTGAAELDEDFTEVVFRFTGARTPEVLPGLGDSVDTPPEAASPSYSWKERMRQRREVPLGFTESTACTAKPWTMSTPTSSPPIYNPAHPPFFNAYIRGKKT